MKNDYLIRENPWKALIWFAFPIILGNFFQQTYTMIDSVIVGRYVSQNALAAVGASYSLTNIFISIATGGGMGASIVVSRYFGSKDYKKMKTAVYTALIFFLSASLLLSCFGLLFSKKIMLLLNTPSDILNAALSYLNIYFMGLPFLFMYNVLSSMFNALGKSRIPLCFLIFSSIFNIVLDIFMVRQLNMGIAGVAWATLIAQGISAILSFFTLRSELKKMKSENPCVIDFTELSSMVKIAIPSVLQQSTISIGMILVQSVINVFGAEVVAGFSAAMRIESLCIVPMLGIGNAISSYTAQNIGASQEERVIMGYHVANKLVIFCGMLILIILELFHEPIIFSFMGKEGTPLALSIGNSYLKFMGFFFFLIGFKVSVDGLLRGAGDMKMFTIANIANLFIRVLVAKIFAPRFGVFMIWTAVPFGWFVNWLISFLQYRTEKWKTIYQSTVLK